MIQMERRAISAVRPWSSIDAESGTVFDRAMLPQPDEQEVRVCLMCEHCADACDICDGLGNLTQKRRAGRQPLDIDLDLLRDMMRLRRCNREMCAALGVGDTTLRRYKKKVNEEETT